MAQKETEYPRAKELADIQGYINTVPFKLSGLAGKKVILLDFWTYSCINCLRTLPYLNAWYQKYQNDGLVIIGVHSPEFDFEKNFDQCVSAAVQRLGIKYPVVLDSQPKVHGMPIRNEYWPEEYLIDIDGFVVHNQIGEGDYDKTEEAIQAALIERQKVLGLSQKIDTSLASPAGVVTVSSTGLGSPETYFGSARNEYLGNGAPGVAGIQTLGIPSQQVLNTLYLGGTWNFADQYAENTSATATVSYVYSAKNVYFVATAKNQVKIKIYRDGILLTGAEAGSDVAPDGTVTIQENRLYSLVQALFRLWPAHFAGRDFGESWFGCLYIYFRVMAQIVILLLFWCLFY